MPSAAFASGIAAVAPSVTASAAPTARCFLRITFLPLDRAAACRCRYSLTPAARLSGLHPPPSPCGPGGGTDAQYAPSIRKGPHAQLLLADLPQPRQPVRLKDEEYDDERADDHGGQVIDLRRRERKPQLRQHEPQDDRKNIDQRRAEVRPREAPEPADDHHEQNAEALTDVEYFGFRPAI